MSEAATRSVPKPAPLAPLSREQRKSGALRINEIDGIRGWASLSVVVFHMLIETFSVIHPEFSKPQYAFFVDGTMAVCIFFILSGDALSTPTFSGGSAASLHRTVVKRYFRLSLPIFVATLIGFALFRMGIFTNATAGHIVHRDEWLSKFMSANVGTQDLIRFPFFDVFNTDSSVHVDKRINPFLWTMPIELLGSMLVFVFVYVSGTLKRPRIALFAIIIFLFCASDWFALFFFGVFFAHLRAGGTLARLQANIAVRIFGPLLALCAYSLEYYLRSTPPSTGSDGIIGAFMAAVRHHEKLVVAAMFIAGIYLSKDLCSLFKCRISQFLGKVSFPIYLMQIIVLCTITSALIMRYENDLHLRSACIGIAAFSIAVTLIAGYAFSFLEGFCMRAANFIAKSATLQR